MLACCIVLMSKGHTAIWPPQDLLTEGSKVGTYALTASLEYHLYRPSWPFQSH